MFFLAVWFKKYTEERIRPKDALQKALLFVQMPNDVTFVLCS